MNYQSYCTMCKKHRIINPYENEEHYNRAYGIVEREAPLVIRPKHKESLESLASIVNNIRHKRSKRAAKPKSEPKEPKPKKIKAEKAPRPSRKIYTDEEIKERRKEARRKKRAANKLLGLTVDGKPRSRRDVAMSEEERIARRKQWNKEYQARNKERFNAYERARRAKKRAEAREKRESLLLSQKSGSCNRSDEPMSAVA